jgi:predicted O-methyltransferase YrrM
MNRVDALITAGVQQHGDELGRARAWAQRRNDLDKFPECGAYDWLESQILYLLVRVTRPRLVLEISPSSGYSSGFILLALHRNGAGRLLSFDRRPEVEARARANFAGAGIDARRWTFYAGEARETVEAAAVGDDPIDLLFMDSEHTREFATWYVRVLFPSVPEGGLIHVHDVRPRGEQPQHPCDEGEGRVVWSYLTRSADERDYRYISDIVLAKGDEAEPIPGLTRWPFTDRRVGSNGVEFNPSLWFVKNGRVR